MTSRFFRREIGWEAYREAVGLAPPMTPSGEPFGAPPAQYNIAPGAHAPVLRLSAPGLYLGDYAPRGRAIVQPAFWGLIPTWWTGGPGERPFSSFSARAETLETSRAFQGPLRHGRCLVPASGFYAWSGPKGAATPFAFGLRDFDWFCFAGLWTRVMIDGSELDTFAIVTCAPNDAVASFSSSMPVILHPDHFRRWLDPMNRDPQGLLRPYPADEMRCWPAHPRVGDVRNQGAEMIGDPDAG
ncbi:MAG: SOS response-associated peptidase [Hyphomonadaceae bacterium]